MDKYIKREDVLAKKVTLFATQMIDHETNEMTELGGLFINCVLVGDINEIPAADVRENKRGAWQMNDDEFYYHCSECGRFIFEDFRFAFCPYCGADMREGEQ